ncbi:ribose 5-phosphate isomerase A [Haloarcula marismortui ATCC 43049]|uniref:Ribose-5-phosphate isomerase A n=2 Tax=Haloarcula marismortui (strain ATCC 43049 / DSM 3752 / JCM 8966 / VKM B-1809) TaxID=272569 RepID=RPIA_HALMA|nr:ribose-5-phosphate isomerase RpiA [Haloarcula marismortui]Q5UZD7.1 RecName: Full=Ribose-5-phosphate isomerase A; AltName: Full=Phosphoriboisomerase A; Short=PRI [Haloarcula marismortui ATCC 43049]AAV47366.1 ribose 5-phosphate isomerase A [Haloarcula marismortui ATCC 43049]QCP92070.1 ribose-5-phosphate isomerase RpiA [Haloarcula marismortui ATCC 43049]
MKQGGSDAAKQAAGESAAEAVEDATVVGLGTGSTAAYAIRAIGQAVDAGLDVVGVPTSFQSRQLARDCGIPLADLDDVSVDLAIDGADEVASGNLIKGGGAAHAREKIVDASADRFLVVADPTKEAAVLSYPVPVEVLPMARSTVVTAVEELGGDPTLRRAERKDGPVVTDNGNLVLDCDFNSIHDPAALASDLAALPGVVEHGLFVGMADEIHVGTADGVTVRTLSK